MRPSAEDLLSRELAALPTLAPSPETDARVLAAMRAAAAEAGAERRATTRGRPAFQASRRSVYFGLAATVAVAALTLVLLTEGGGPKGPVIAVTAPSGARPAPVPVPVSTASNDYHALVEQSARLERALFTLPAQRRVMSAGTAGTIATLEDRLTLIDVGLTEATIAGAEVGEREVLWRERVDVMNALLQVRYAQSQVFDF